jgi:hypothetical protein
MQECETGPGKSGYVKRVTVRPGGAGHARSGVISDGAVKSRMRVKRSATAAAKELKPRSET